MKLIIAGGRHYLLTDADRAFLDTLRAEVSEVVSGGATGADLGGELWAGAHGIAIKRITPDWRKHGRAAGPIRNEDMAKYADAVALFPGGKGTASMARLAEQYGLVIHDRRNLGGGA